MSNAYSSHTCVLTSPGMTANITSRNMALKRCILVEMFASQPTPVPAAVPPCFFYRYWGGFFTYRGIPSMLYRLCATSLITGTQGSPMWFGKATSRVSFVEHRQFCGKRTLNLLSLRRRERRGEREKERESEIERKLLRCCNESK